MCFYFIAKIYDLISRAARGPRVNSRSLQTRVVHIYFYVSEYRVFSLTWPDLCKFIGTKESVCIRKEFNSQRIGLGHQHGRRFIVLGHQYGRRDVM